jgi:hypothetical protein
MDIIDTNTLDSLIEPTLKITKEEFIIEKIYRLKLGFGSYYAYEDVNIEQLYKYYLFACYLIKQQIKENNIIGFYKNFNYNKNDFSIVIYYNYDISTEIFNILPSKLYGINIIKRKFNNDLSDINEKDIKQLIVEKLDTSIEEFENTPINNLPMNFKMIDYHFGEDAKMIINKKYFMVASHFIELYLNTIKDFNIYSIGNYNHFDPEKGIKKDDPKQYELTGKVTKNIRCKLLMAPEELINSIPKKLLDIDIIIKNIVNKEVKIDFMHGTFNIDENKLIDFDVELTIAYENKLLFLFNKNLVVSYYYGNADDKHEISYTDDSIIFTVTKIHQKDNWIRHLAGAHGSKIIPKKKYKYIVLREHHEKN